MDNDQSELIVTIWKRLGGSRVGRKELRTIQHELIKRNGGAGQSPASIARVLADEGAELIHPEIIEFDARWRSAQIAADEKRFKNVSLILSEEPLSLDNTETLIRELEAQRQKLAEGDDRERWEQLRGLAIEAREAAQTLSKDKAADDRTRREQKEIGQWFAIWLQTPELFDQWLELRKRSREFREMFER
jgi:hypothetical protein